MGDVVTMAAADGDVQASARVRRWQAAWESLDPDQVLALYRADATHASGAVRSIMPGRTDGMLRGLPEISAYARGVCQRVQSLDFALTRVTEIGTRSFVEYRRTMNGDADKQVGVLEVLDWDGDKLAAVRVYHF